MFDVMPRKFLETLGGGVASDSKSNLGSMLWNAERLCFYTKVAELHQLVIFISPMTDVAYLTRL